MPFTDTDSPSVEVATARLIVAILFPDLRGTDRTAKILELANLPADDTLTV